MCACVRACVRAFVRACVCVCVCTVCACVFVFVLSPGKVFTSEKREVFDALREGEQLDLRLSDEKMIL